MRKASQGLLPHYLRLFITLLGLRPESEEWLLHVRAEEQVASVLVLPDMH